MLWSRKLIKPIELKDGRVLDRLIEARNLYVELPERSRNSPHWQNAAGAIMAAATSQDTGDVAYATARLLLAVRAEGLR